MSEKEFKCGYYAGKLDFLNEQTYLALKQKSEICEQFIIGIPSNELIERIFGGLGGYNAEVLRAYLQDFEWVTRVEILDRETIHYQKAQERFGFDLCYFGNVYGQAFEEDIRVLSSRGVGLRSAQPGELPTWEKEYTGVTQQEKKKMGFFAGHTEELTGKIGVKQRTHQDALEVALSNVRPDQKIVLYGTGKYFEEYMARYGGKKQCLPAYAIDGNESLWGTTKLGVEIKSPDALKEEIPADTLVVTCAKDYGPMLERILSYGPFNYRSMHYDNASSLLEEFAIALTDEAAYLERAHNALYKIIAEFDRVCTKYGLHYYMICGSLIGVLRHHDIIPWDDDLDITMPREDFEKLQEIAKNEWADGHYTFQQYDKLGNGVFLDCMNRLIYNDEYFPTRIFEKVAGRTEMDVENKMVLDIYVLDKASNDQKRHMRHMNMMKAVYNLCMGHRGEIDYTEYQSLPATTLAVIKLANSIGRMLPLKFLVFLYEKLRKYAVNEECNDYYMANCVITVIERRFPIRVFGEGLRLPFHDASVMAPSDPDGLMKAMLYGDYMHFPPVAVRKPSHYFNADICIW